MKVACLLTTAFLALGITCCDARVVIAELSQNDFDRRIEKGRTLVKFYAPWCKHCKKFEPIFQDAADALKDRMRLVRVDATINAGLKSRFQVTAYPKLILFEDGKQVDVYEGARTFEGLKEYALRRTAPPLKEFSSLEDLEINAPTRNISLFPVSFVLLASRDPAKQAETKRFRRKIYQLAKEKLSTHHFYSTVDEAIIEKMCAEVDCDLPALVRYEAGETPEVFEEEDEERMKGWVEWRNHAILGNLGAHNFALLKSAAKFLGVAMYNGESTTKSQLDYLEEVGKIARRSTTPLPRLAYESFVFAKIDGSVFKDYLLDYDIELESLPRMLILDSEQERFYTHIPGQSDLPQYLTNITLGIAPYKRDGIYRIPARVYRFFGENPIKGGIILILISTVIFLGGWVCCCLEEGEEMYDFDEEERKEFEKIATAALFEEQLDGGLPQMPRKRSGKQKSNENEKGDDSKAEEKAEEKKADDNVKDKSDKTKSPGAKKND